MTRPTDPLLRMLLVTLDMPDLPDAMKVDAARHLVRMIIELRKAARLKRACQRISQAFGMSLPDRESVEKQA